MRSLTSLPADSHYRDHRSGKPNGMEIVFCPDCGMKCEHTGTNGLENQFGLTCHECNVHWMRWAGHIQNIRIDECEICREEPV